MLLGDEIGRFVFTMSKGRVVTHMSLFRFLDVSFSSPIVVVCSRNFDVIGSVDDHSAAVTTVKLSSNGCQILSCSADR